MLFCSHLPGGKRRILLKTLFWLARMPETGSGSSSWRGACWNSTGRRKQGVTVANNMRPKQLILLVFSWAFAGHYWFVSAWSSLIFRMLHSFAHMGLRNVTSRGEESLVSLNVAFCPAAFCLVPVSGDKLFLSADKI